MANGDRVQSGSPSGGNPQEARTPPASAQPAGGLDRDVACPGCGYNLRGLGVGGVVCPECGTASDVARLLTRRWDKPWYQAPKYNLLAMPAGWVLVSAIGLMFAAAANDVRAGGFMPMPMLLAGWALLTLVGWVLLMVWVCRSMEGLDTLGYALLVHVALGGYLVGLPMFVAGLGWTVGEVIDLLHASGAQQNLFWSGLLLVGGVGLFFVGRSIERFVAGYCIRLYLRRVPA